MKQRLTITMRILIPAICLLFLSSNSFGQSAPDGNATAQQSLWEKYTAKCFHPKFVVDDQVIDDNAAKKVLNEIDPGAVTRVLIAHGNASQPRDVVYVITGRAKIRVYQEKFAKFSKTYDAYLKLHKNWDGKLAYILNGKAVSGSITEIIDNLYNIPAGQIVGVLFSEGEAFDWATGTVHITTKQ